MPLLLGEPLYTNSGGGRGKKTHDPFLVIVYFTICGETSGSCLFPYSIPLVLLSHMFSV